MNSEFIVKVKNATNNIRKITDDDIVDLGLKMDKLIKSIESTIVNHPDIGLRQLKSNYKEIRREYRFTRPKVLQRLEELNKEGKDDYYTDYSNTKEVGLKIEEALGYLLELLLAYFPETAKKNSGKYKEFLPDKFYLVNDSNSPPEKESPKDFKDLFTDENLIQACIDVLKKVEPPLLSNEEKWIGKTKGGIVVWIDQMKINGLIHHYPDKVYSKLISDKFHPFSISEGLFRKLPQRANSQYKLEFKSLLSQVSHSVK